MEERPDGWAIVTGRIQWSAKSILIAAVALAVMNTIAYISGRNYPDWNETQAQSTSH